MYSEKPSEKNENVNEPGTSYRTAGKHAVRVFSSFQQQEDELVAYWASITPLQRLKHLHEMVIASFGLTTEQLKKPKLNHSINVISYEP